MCAGFATRATKNGIDITNQFISEVVLKGKIFYIAGPITGITDYQSAFHAAAMFLREQGAVVLNPAVLPEGLKSHDAYMRITLAMLAEADAIAFLPGWLASKGSRMEHIRANELELPEYELELHSSGMMVESIRPMEKLSDVNCADLIALHQVLEHTKRLWSPV